MECQDLFDEFKSNFLHTQTKNLYNSDLKEYINITGNDILNTRAEDVKKYYEYLKKRVGEQKIAPSTMTRKFRELHSFSEYIIQNHDSAYINHFSEYLPFLSKDAKLVKVRPVEDVDRLLEAAASDTQAFLIIAVIFRLGLSTSEICHLKWEMLQQYDGRLVLFLPERRTPLEVPPDLTRLILKRMEETGEDKGLVFKNKWGNPVNRQYVGRVLKAYSEKAGIKGVSVTTLRNMYGCNAFTYGVPADVIAKELGITGYHIQRYNNLAYARDFGRNSSNLVHIRIEDLPE